MNWLFALLEVVVKCLIAVFVGFGVASLILGFAMVGMGIDEFGRTGPPPGPALIGSGAGLLTTGSMLLLLFVGPISKFRWLSKDWLDSKPVKGAAMGSGYWNASH